MAKGDKGDNEDKGNREKSVCSSISTPNRTEAELHKKKEGTEGSAPRGIRGIRVIRWIRGRREDKEDECDTGG